jgi:hypothetical protein
LERCAERAGFGAAHLLVRPTAHHSCESPTLRALCCAELCCAAVPCGSSVTRACDLQELFFCATESCCRFVCDRCTQVTPAPPLCCAALALALALTASIRLPIHIHTYIPSGEHRHILLPVVSQHILLLHRAQSQKPVPHFPPSLSSPPDRFLRSPPAVMIGVCEWRCETCLECPVCFHTLTPTQRAGTAGATAGTGAGAGGDGGGSTLEYVCESCEWCSSSVGVCGPTPAAALGTCSADPTHRLASLHPHSVTVFSQSE